MESKPQLSVCNKKAGGESGIRTHVTLSSKHAFQSCAFSHSAISPRDRTVFVSKSAVGSYCRYLRQPVELLRFYGPGSGTATSRQPSAVSIQPSAISQFTCMR